MVLKKRSSAYFEDAACILIALHLHTNEAMLDFGHKLTQDLFGTNLDTVFSNIIEYQIYLHH